MFNKYPSCGASKHFPGPWVELLQEAGDEGCRVVEIGPPEWLALIDLAGSGKLQLSCQHVA
ncbi:hypothetical protein V2A89_33730, partial [Pseudomonas aeruginosa]